MIWFFNFFLMFFLSLKSSFFNSYIEFFYASSFLILVSFCSIPLVYSAFFYSINFMEKFFLFTLGLIFFISMSFIISSPFYFILNLEVSTLLIFFLIMNFSKDFDKISSSVFMLLFNLVGSLPFFMFMSYFFALSFPSLLNIEFFSFDSFVIFFFFSLILISKVPFIFFHFWLSKAHVASFGYCSMILASLLLKLGTFGLFKFMYFFFPNSYILISLTSILAGFCFLLFGMLMMRFIDLKVLVASSSVLHMAFMYPMICFFSSPGIFSCIFMMVGHGLISYFLFYFVSMFYEMNLNRSFDFFKSNSLVLGVLMMGFVFFMLLNSGFPPFMNFYSEFKMFFFGFFMGPFMSLIIVISLLISFFFLGFSFFKSNFGFKILMFKEWFKDKILMEILFYLTMFSFCGFF